MPRKGQFKIRAIRTQAEWVAIEAMQKKLVDELPFVHRETRQWWIARNGDKPVGYAAMNITGDCGWFSICGVLAKHRGNGLQKRLIDVRLRHARRGGLAAVYTYTLNGNHPSANSLIKKGFKQCTPPDRHFGKWAGKRDVLYWKHEL